MSGKSRAANENVDKLKLKEWVSTPKGTVQFKAHWNQVCVPDSDASMCFCLTSVVTTFTLPHRHTKHVQNAEPAYWWIVMWYHGRSHVETPSSCSVESLFFSDFCILQLALWLKSQPWNSHFGCKLRQPHVYSIKISHNHLSRRSPFQQVMLSLSGIWNVLCLGTQLSLHLWKGFLAILFWP